MPDSETKSSHFKGTDFASQVFMEPSEFDFIKLSPLASKILEYLQTHPRARDSLDGIAEWWLMENDIQRKTTEVKFALKELVSTGLVEEVGDGSCIQYQMRRP